MIWFGLALTALLIELFSGTFYLLVLSAALASTGLLNAFFATSLSTNLVVCGVLSLIGIVAVTLLHIKQNGRNQAQLADDNLNLGQTVLILSRSTGGLYQVQYRGTQWQARLNKETGEDVSGQNARIIGHDGNILLIDLNK